MHFHIDHTYFFHSVLIVDFGIYWTLLLLIESGSSEAFDSISEQPEPAQEVYYYQGKHPLCTMLIPSFIQ